MQRKDFISIVSHVNWRNSLLKGTKVFDFFSFYSKKWFHFNFILYIMNYVFAWRVSLRGSQKGFESRWKSAFESRIPCQHNIILKKKKEFFVIVLINISIYLCIYLFVHIDFFIWLFIYLSIYLFISISISGCSDLSIYLSIYLSI